MQGRNVAVEQRVVKKNGGVDEFDARSRGISLRLVELRIPSHAVRNQSARLECHFDLDGMDSTNKAYVDSAIRDNETNMRTYMDMLTQDGEAAMRTHYTAYFDNANAEMGKIDEKINSVHYAVERDINGIIANIIPSVLKTMVPELVREDDMLISDLKTRFDSFTPRMADIQKEILLNIPNSIKIAVKEPTNERDIITEDLKTELYNLNKRIKFISI
ncbi:hypothetical protein FQA39_LY05381 [Lamprigera yunnana]|nr:hypothetical protein FQA39_LY05381 [Lamprigera yunnana]